LIPPVLWPRMWPHKLKVPVLYRCSRIRDLSSALCALHAMGTRAQVRAARLTIHAQTKTVRVSDVIVLREW